MNWGWNLSRKKCVRKVWAKVNVIKHAIEGAAIVDDASLNRLQTLEYMALEAMVKGQGTKEDWHTIAGCLNICETMSKNGIGVEVLTVCEQVQAELVKAAERYKTTGKMGLTGLGIQAIRDLIEYADLQRRSISRSEFERMIDKTRRMIVASRDVVSV
jgi:hypothetical protein